MFRIQDRTLAGKLIRFLTMLASALAVTLAGDRAVTAAGRAYVACSQNQVDVGEDVIDTVRVMFNAASMHQYGCFRAAVESSSVDDFLCGHTAELCGDIRRIARSQFARCFPVVSARIDESLIDEILFDEDMQYSIREGDIGAGLELKMQISLARRRCLAWIDDYPAPTVVALLPQEFVQYRESLGTV